MYFLMLTRILHSYCYASVQVAYGVLDICNWIRAPCSHLKVWKTIAFSSGNICFCFSFANSFSNGLYILSFICLTIWKNVAFSKQSCSVFWLKNRQHGLLPWEFKEMSSIKIVQFVSFLRTNDKLLDKLRVVVCRLVAGTRSSSCGAVCQKNPVHLRRLFHLILSKAKKIKCASYMCTTL